MISGISKLSALPRWPLDAMRILARPAVQLARGLPVWVDTLGIRRSKGPLVVFLPAYGRHGAALLRIYNIAAALREQGWRCLILPSPLTLAQRQRVMRSVCPDVVVMQGARHRLNRPELYPDYPVVYDMDDADFHLPHLRDAVRAAMPHVQAVLGGSQYIVDWSLQAGARQAHVVWTGTPVSGRVCPPQADRPMVVAWAQTRPMDYVSEARFIREVITRAAGQGQKIRFRLYDRIPGDDPEFAQGFAAPGVTVEWRERALYNDFIESLDDVAVGLAPLSEAAFSRGKSFGKVLAYLDARVPVIASDAGEHGVFFKPETGVVTNDPVLWASSLQRLLGDPAARQKMSDAAYRAFRNQLSTKVAAQKVNDTLRQVIHIT